MNYKNSCHSHHTSLDRKIDWSFRLMKQSADAIYLSIHSRNTFFLKTNPSKTPSSIHLFILQIKMIPFHSRPSLSRSLVTWQIMRLIILFKRRMKWSRNFKSKLLRKKWLSFSLNMKSRKLKTLLKILKPLFSLNRTYLRKTRLLRNLPMRLKK